MKKFLPLLVFLLIFSNSALALTVEITTTPDICNYSNGTMSAYAFGGNPYYTYSWSNGATTDSVGGLSAGTTLTVIVTDAIGATATATATIVAQSHLNQPLFTYAGSFACEGFCNARYFTPSWTLGGVPPYSGTFDGVALEYSNLPFPDGIGIPNLCWNAYPYVYIADVNGCNVQYIDYPVSYLPFPAIDSVIVTNASSGNNGSATVFSNGNVWPPYYYLFTYFDGNGYTIPNVSGSEIGSLCPGNYTVQLSSNTGYWNPGTGTWNPESCSSTTAQFTIGGCAVPTNQTTTNIHPTKARLNWNTNNCAVGYKIRYKQTSSATWTTRNVSSNIGYKKITGLAANTQYEWRVRSRCATNPKVWSPWSVSSFFTTTLRLGQFEDVTDLVIYPNPATDILIVEMEGPAQVSHLLVQNSLGQIVLEKNGDGEGNSNTQMDVSSLPAGMYLLTAFTREGKMMKMFVKE